jgi:hypothetical protein
MSHRSEEVRELLRALRVGMNRTATDYTGQHIAMCLYGLQSMRLSRDHRQADSASFEVLDLLTALNDRIAHSEHQMSFSNVASAMYGLKVYPSLSPSPYSNYYTAFLSCIRI